VDASQTNAEVQYFTEPNGGTFTVIADATPLATISTDGDANVPTYRSLPLPAGTKQLEIAVTAGEVKFLGIDLRKGNSGVLYDSLGLNGAFTTVISRTFAPGQWSQELKHAAPSLVILNYGTNESGFGTFVDKQYEGELRASIQKVRAALPGVSILIMSPMDRAQRTGIDSVQTLPSIPKIVAIQKRVAEEQHCAFFDTFDAMGGAGTMARWYDAKPRLVSADFIHPFPQGALLVGQLLVNHLYLGYDRWKQSQGIPLVPSPQIEPKKPVPAANHVRPKLPEQPAANSPGTTPIAPPKVDTTPTAENSPASSQQNDEK
jgi:lysophospholipase L1-like esterase